MVTVYLMCVVWQEGMVSVCLTCVLILRNGLVCVSRIAYGITEWLACFVCGVLHDGMVAMFLICSVWHFEMVSLCLMVGLWHYGVIRLYSV